jgi:1,4-alpha-glucan branching enzyme
MLHSHLPYYRKAGMWPFGEENLYECMAETYLPLLNALTELKEQGIRANLTLGVTPILAEQLYDEHLNQGFIEYLESRIEAVSQDVVRYENATDPMLKQKHKLACFYSEWFSKALDDFTNKYGKNLLAGFKALQDAGCIEITTSAATHGFLPLLATDASIEAQLQAGVEAYKKYFGRAPKGIWLPECAYRPAQEIQDESGQTYTRPSIDAFLYKYGIQYFFTEYHAIEGASSSTSRRVFGIYDWDTRYVPMAASIVAGQQRADLTTDHAYWMRDYPVAVMGRNNRASFQVWSAAYGYPGDGLYREFHKRDDRSGMHYWKLTSKECGLGDKHLYYPDEAFSKAREHADHFVHMVGELAKSRFEATGEKPLIMVSFDTELFGHWWFEGIEWIKQVCLNMSKQQTVTPLTATAYLEQTPPKHAITLPESTWGQGGHFWVWNNHHTDWMWPVIYDAEYKMRSLVSQFANTQDPLEVKTLNMALRQILLLESSDWPFLVTTFQAKDYAIDRFNEHKDRFWALAEMLDSGTIDESKIDAMFDIDNCFPELDFRSFQSAPMPSAQGTTAQTVSL